jgi:anti-sigma regulatory factor (Ser/Thr protein kinase)
MSTEQAELGPVEYVRHRWPADPDQAARVRAAMRGWLLSLRFSAEQSDEILLAVSEAVLNAVTHADRPGQRGMVEIRLWTEPGMLCIEVADEGSWCEPVAGKVGMGVKLMRSLVESVVIHVGAGGTRVLLRHPLPPGAHALGRRSGRADGAAPSPRRRVDKPEDLGGR